MSTTSQQKREATSRRAIFPCCQAKGCHQDALPGRDFCLRCFEELEAIEIEQLQKLVNFEGRYKLARTAEAKRIIGLSLLALAGIIVVACFANLTN